MTERLNDRIPAARARSRTQLLVARLCTTSALVVLVSGVLFAQTVTNDSPAQRAARLMAGDQVAVTVFRETTLTATVFVDDANQIALPRLGVLSVGNLTSDMLRDTLRARYATFLRDPSVDVRTLRRVTVNGAVAKPDVYLIDPTMTLRDVIARAGGVAPDGDAHKVSIVRGGAATPYPNWSDGAQGQTGLRSGDEVLVGRRNWFALNLGPVVGIAGLLTSLAIAFRR